MTLSLLRSTLLLTATVLATACATGSSPQGPANYRVVGTEPFWGVQVAGEALHFTTLEDQAGKHLQGRRAVRPDGVRYEGSDGAVPFELELDRGECSDGMSDRQYAYDARFRYGETRYTGCAEEVP